jgi:hypothetical protein
VVNKIRSRDLNTEGTFKLTPKESAEIDAIRSRKMACTLLMESLVKIAADTFELEDEWWKKVTKRLDLDTAINWTLDHRTGEVKPKC